MQLLIYLMLAFIILWIASTLASFVNKKTDNGFLTAVAWFGSAYLMLELVLTLAKKMY
jgi:hypothetical protein